MSGFQLNLPKTVVIPLSLVDLPTWRAQFQNINPDWRNIQVSTKAKYLGFVLGPGRGHDTYDKPLAKFRQRAREWGRAGAGLALTSLAYSVYILPVVLFVAQLDAPPPHWPSVERAALRNLLPGPAAWFTPAVVRGLPHLGFSKGFADLTLLYRAVQFRVATMEASASGGLRIGARARQLDLAIQDSPLLLRGGAWRTWYQGSFLFQLRDSLRFCAAQGLTQRGLEDTLAQHAARPFPPDLRLSIRRRWQKSAWKLLVPDYRPSLHLFMEARLRRWTLDLFPGVRAERALRMFPALKSQVPPRVLAAVLRTLWNGWITARRMQRQGQERANLCCFGCPLRDPIEHYAHCPHVSNFARTHLRLQRPLTPEARMADFLLLDTPPTPPRIQLLTLQALRTAAVYRAHNMWRHCPSATPVAMRQSLSQHLKESVRGHPAATRLVTNLFAAAPPPLPAP